VRDASDDEQIGAEIGDETLEVFLLLVEPAACGSPHRAEDFHPVSGVMEIEIGLEHGVVGVVDDAVTEQNDPAGALFFQDAFEIGEHLPVFYKGGNPALLLVSPKNAVLFQDFDRFGNRHFPNHNLFDPNAFQGLKTDPETRRVGAYGKAESVALPVVGGLDAAINIRDDRLPPGILKGCVVVASFFAQGIEGKGKIFRAGAERDGAACEFGTLVRIIPFRRIENLPLSIRGDKLPRLGSGSDFRKRFEESVRARDFHIF